MGLNKLLLLFVLFIFLFLGIHIVSAAVFDDWVLEGNTFSVNNEEFFVSAAEDGTTAMFKSDEAFLVIDLNATKRYKSYLFAVADKKFVLKSHPDIVVEGEGKASTAITKFHITVEEQTSNVVMSMNVTSLENVNIGDEITVGIIITNNGKAQIANAVFENNLLPYFQKKDKLKIKKGEDVSTWDGDEAADKIYWKGNIKANESITLIYTVKLKTINTSEDKVELPQATLSFKEDFDVTLKTDPVSIGVVNPLVISITSPNNNTLGIGKEEEFTLALNNVHPAYPINFKNFKLNVPEEITIVGHSDGFSEDKNTLSLYGSLQPNSNTTPRFSLKSDKTAVSPLQIYYSYEIGGYTVEGHYSSDIVASVIELVPFIETNKRAFNYKDEMIIKLFLENKNNLSFYDLSGDVDMGFYKESFEREDLGSNEKIVAALITQKIPAISKDEVIEIKYKGSYSDEKGKKFYFSLNDFINVSKKEGFILPFRIVHFPYRYLNNETMEIIVALQDLNQSFEWLELSTFDSNQKNNLKTTRLSKIDMAASLKENRVMGHLFGYNIINEDSTKIENLSLKTNIKYKKDDDIYFASYATNELLSNYEMIIESMKIAKNYTEKLSKDENETKKTEENATMTQEMSIKGSLGKFITDTIIIILIIGFVVLIGYGYVNQTALKKKIVNLKENIKSKETSDISAPKPGHDYDELKKFINECRQKNIDEKIIKNKLIKEGWMKDVVEEFLK